MTKRVFVRECAPKVSTYARGRHRIGTKYYGFKHTIDVDVDDLILSENDPRADKIDPNHVKDIQINLQTAGYEEDGELPCVKESKQFPGKYEVIDQHHLISALKNINQQKWTVDVYVYTGNYGEAHEWAAAGDFGLSVNNEHLITKKTTMASVVHAALMKIRTCGYIFEPETPVDDDNIRLWMKECKHDQVFASGKITEMVNKIQHPTKLTGAKIRPLDNETIKTLCTASGGNYGIGVLNSGYYGFIVKTDNYAADGPKGYNQMVTTLHSNRTPLFITYSGKDDADKIVGNHEGYFDKMHETYTKHMQSVKIFHGIQFPLLTKKEFFAKIKAVAIGQVDGEWSVGDEFIERPLNDD